MLSLLNAGMLNIMNFLVIKSKKQTKTQKIER